MRRLRERLALRLAPWLATHVYVDQDLYRWTLNDSSYSTTYSYIEWKDTA
jgi:hypothetical protein